MRHLIAAAIVSLCPTEVGAQEFDTRAKLVEELYKQAKESPTAIGINHQGNIIEILVAPDQSWTMIMTFPNGKSRILMVGEGWDYWKDRAALNEGL